MNRLVGIQLNIMLILGGICGFIFLFLLFMKISNKVKKYAFLKMSLWTMILLFSDRLVYLYDGNNSNIGFWMIRICSFLAYAATLVFIDGVTNYLYFMADNENVDFANTKILKAARITYVAGLAVLVVAQFTGFIYSFDDLNYFQYGKLYFLIYVMPLVTVILQLIFVFKSRRSIRKNVFVSIMVFYGLPDVVAGLQLLIFGNSFVAICIACSAIFIYFFALYDQNKVLIKAANNELLAAKEMQEKTSELLNETIETLASAIDANDNYTHGHSTRVAKYAKKIASLSGMSEQECEAVYLAALLHDVGKIGIENIIINKNGKLTAEEYEEVKKHSALGGKILSKISATNVLEIGAKYHHERFDGTGYPEGLRGKEIPKIARIIAVADAYDAMTSRRSYRNQIAQQRVREELVKGLGTQFDPEYAKLMIHMIDMDSEYRMRENSNDSAFGEMIFFNFDEYKSAVSPGFRITNHQATVKIRYKSYKDDAKCVPTILLYDSLDERYLENEALREELEFVEYGAICLDGTVIKGQVRELKDSVTSTGNARSDHGVMQEAVIQLAKQADHMLVKVTTNDSIHEVIIALNDKSSYVFMALTGQDCMLDIMDVKVDEYPISPSYIPRIAEEQTFIDGPQGDIPNFEIDGWRANHSEAIPYKDSTEVIFDTISLPSARRLWHCPIICVYTSDDGKIDGPNYKELALVRLDGESWSEYGDIINDTVVTKDKSFVDWDDWKKKIKMGLSCKLNLTFDGSYIVQKVEAGGVTINNQIILPYVVDKLYFFFTGDQCAITNIRIDRV